MNYSIRTVREELRTATKTANKKNQVLAWPPNSFTTFQYIFREDVFNSTLEYLLEPSNIKCWCFM
jgi:hypothetical protein